MTVICGFFVSTGPLGWELPAESGCHVLASPDRVWEKRSLDKRHGGRIGTLLDRTLI